VRVPQISLGSLKATFRAYIRSSEAPALFASPYCQLAAVWAWKLNGFLIWEYELAAPTA